MVSVVREKMKTTQTIVALMLCTGACLASDSTSPTGLHGVVTATPAILALNGTLRASVIVSNAGPETITIDTRPDEIIQPETERFGPVTRERGSRLTITLYQDESRGFRTGGKKIGFRSRAHQIALKPGESHTEPLSFDLSLPYIPSVALQEGPAKVKATLHLVINGEKIDLPCQECHLELKKDRDRTTTKSTLSSEAAPSAAPSER
jgi:hypothetical protein